MVTINVNMPENIIVGTSVELSCESTWNATISIDISWRRPDSIGSYITVSGRIKSNISSGFSNLTITQVRKTHEGVYQCVVGPKDDGYIRGPTVTKSVYLNIIGEEI